MKTQPTNKPEDNIIENRVGLFIKITEINAWEKEHWSYVLDACIQGAAVINVLMSFQRLANSLFLEVENKTKTHYDILGRGTKLFAASKYSIEFFDEVEFEDGGDKYVLKNASTNLHCRLTGSYKNSCISLDTKISLKKIIGARNAIRDKGENKIYKNLESIFLKA